MFRTAELNRTLSKQEYQDQVPVLRQELLIVQNKLKTADFPVIIVFAGVDGAGKSETVNLLHAWMDPRWLISRAFGDLSDEERDRPEFWRFWRELPPNGRIGMYLSSWYSKPVLDRVYERINEGELDRRLDRIKKFEKALADDGVLILKFWMHLSKENQKKRLKRLEKNPLLHWRISSSDWEHWKMYDKFIAAAEHTLMKTSTGEAPWKIVEGYDERYRTVAVASIIKDAIKHHLQERRRAAQAEEKIATPSEVMQSAEPVVANGNLVTVLSRLDISKALAKSKYRTQLIKYQGKLNQLQEQARQKKVSTIIVMEGWDAAGKGGAIRRIITAVDSRDYQVIQISAPSDEELSHHYLWRFWRYLPRAGRITIFDRSWYGRVLVERVEGFAKPREWHRAYAEINDFEEQLVEHGIVLLKFWVHITKEEQLKRFEAREQTPYKSWKLTDDDWRNRERWEDYELAVNDMMERTSTQMAPWTLVEGNDKRYARIKVLKTVCNRLQAAVEK